MKSWSVASVALFCVLSGSQAFAQDASPTDHFKDSILPFVSANCFVCHGKTRQSGDFNLEALLTPDSIVKNREDWKMVLERLETSTMPPRSLPPKSMPAG